MSKWGRQRLRDRSPDICEEQRVPSLRQRKACEPVYSPRKTKQPSTRRQARESPELSLNQDLNLNSYQSVVGDEVQFASRRIAQSDDDSLEEFSPTYEEDTEAEGEMDTISPFVHQDMFFNPDTSLMSAFGSLMLPDSFITSSEPLVEDSMVGNECLNTPPYRSPSPVITPIMSPEPPQTPEPPVTSQQSESGSTRQLRSKRVSPQSKVPPVIPNKKVRRLSPPATPLKPVTRNTNQDKKDIVPDIKKVKKAPVTPVKKAKTRNRHAPSKKDEERPPKSSIVPYEGPAASDFWAERPSFPAIKPDKESSSELEKSFKENLLDFVEHSENYERPGKLKRLKLINFMCHDDFDEDWHRVLNYITADNGAGKSAILVGLQLVFGAKASTTMRTTSVKDLIQSGKDQAQIEVALTNDGTMNLEKYGKEIGIIRTILWNGTSRYQIRTRDGKGKRSLSRKELELIKATLQIMVDNPAMILNQEASRNFLHTTDPQALYSYFYRGLNLEHCEILLIRSKDDIEAARMILSSKHKLLEELLAKARESKSNYDAVLMIETGVERAQALTIEYHWAIVYRVKEELTTLQYNLDSVKEKCADLEKNLKELSEQQSSLDSTQESSKSQLKKLKRILQSKREEHELKSREAHSHRQEFGAAKAKLANINKIIADKKKRLERIESEVDRIREESDAQYQQRVQQIEEQRRELEQRKIVAKEQLRVAKADKEDAYTKYDRCKQKEIEWHEKSEDIQFRIREKKHELINIEKKQNSKYNRYGSEMVKLMAEIEKMVKKNQFKEPPMGPQSVCYTVKEQFREYAPLIEHILGSTLFQIRVGNKEDKTLLQQLMKKIYGKNKAQPDILYHPMKTRERYNLLNVKAMSGQNTVLDALDITDDDPVIVNWLADSNGIERILLFRTEEEACNIMKQARRVPRGCNMAYSLNFKRIHADPHYRSMVINPVKTKTTYVQITSHLGNDELVRNEIRDLEREASEILRMLENAKKETKVAKDWDRAVDHQLRAAQYEVNSLETALQGLDETIAQGPDLASYIEDAEELKEGIKQNSYEKGQLETLVKDLKPNYDSAEADRKSLAETILTIENEIQTVENQDDFAKRANDLRIKIKNLNEELSNQNASKQSLSKKVKEVTASLEKCTKVATSKGPRVETKRDPSAVKEDLRCLEQELHRNRHKINQKTRLKEEWERAQKVADEVEEDIRVAGNLIDALIPTITSQFRRFNKKKNDFGNTIQSCFQSLVSSRNLGGRLIIDHNERNLMFWVCPDTNAEERVKVYKKNLEQGVLYKKGMRDYISGLSGGERSFSTICFMVSMWKAMEAPFYILDEFDVFMDQANRKASHLILNAHTRSQPQAQFLFITPLKLDSIINTENAKVLRLFPPIRDAAVSAEDEEARRAKLMKLAEEKQKRSRKRGCFEDGNGKRMDDYYDYLYKPPASTVLPVPIMC